VTSLTFDPCLWSGECDAFVPAPAACNRVGFGGVTIVGQRRSGAQEVGLMWTLLRVVSGALLAAHGLVHLLYLVTNAQDPRWPFALARSWVVPEPVRRPVGVVLIGVTVVLFVLLGLAVWGVPGLSAIWPALAIAGSTASLVTLVLFWNAQLVLGVVIDVALIVVAVLRPEWTDRIG
jgi:hypothetical protein